MRANSSNTFKSVFRLVTGAAVVLAALLVTPGAAEACAVCFQAKTDASRVAFIVTTGVLTFLPLLVFGAIGFWVRRQFARASQQERLEEMVVSPESAASL